MKNFMEDNQEQHTILRLVENQQAISDNVGKLVDNVTQLTLALGKLEARIAKLET